LLGREGSERLKNFFILIILGFILSGCATYKFQKSTASGAGGYLACYDGKPILEYTAGKEKSLPDLALAKERFKRRRAVVEYYYKRMDLIESRLKEYFWDAPKMLIDLLGGVLRWPVTAIEDYKYNRDPKYKEKVDKLDEQKDDLEKARVSALKEKLAAYIVQDLDKEPSSPNAVTAVSVAPKTELTREPLSQIPALPVAQEVTLAPVSASVSVPAVESAPVSIVESPQGIKPVVIAPEPVKKISLPPVAVIIAKPAKGNSPLTVSFSGQKSYSKSQKIVAYDWNFGDGDTSAKKNTVNTYWSTTFGPRNFTVTLTVRDDAGNSSVASTVIEVNTK
jgi:hypothetical protein